eukprot:TRINITY_DN3677_c0_g1_i3.p1 TRINITY_DN3677_c0_g1~~TRINITY_DN3677_c0_g1_i3.p1  ORF type:complete len:261 (-),score=61.48 TRINITY_DN3677_c0_g1_i3:790-1536(-)
MPTDWESLKVRLPIAKTGEDKAKRAELWKQFNVAGGKSLALFELDAGIQKVLECEELFDAKPAIRKAHVLAREINPRGDKDNLEFAEFRLLLVYLKGLMDVYQMFTDIDRSKDKALSLEELTAAGPKLAEVGIDIKDPAALWTQLKGTNACLEFDEFSDWAVRQGVGGQDLMEQAAAFDQAQHAQVLEHLSALSAAGDGRCSVQILVSFMKRLTKPLQEHDVLMLVNSSGAATDGQVVIAGFVDYLYG